MLRHGWQLLTLGWRQLAGPLAFWWLGGWLLALVVKISGIQIGGWPTLMGLLALSAWLLGLAVRSRQVTGTVRSIGTLWVMLAGTAVWWLPLGWAGYLATLQASIQIPAAIQNVIFNTRYDWLPIVGPVWLFGWVLSWKWLPALRQQLQVTTGWRQYWRMGWQTSWWSVLKTNRDLGSVLVSWCGVAVLAAGSVWLSGWWSQQLSRVLAVLSIVSLQTMWWLCLMGKWSQWWPMTAIAARWRRASVVIIIGLLSLSSYASWWLGAPKATNPAIIAHRGVNGHDGVQNTTAALKSTVKQTHPEMVEMDIQPTADRHWVVMHDPTLKALAGQPGPVRDYPVDQLKHLPLHEHGQRGYLSTFKQYFAVARQLRQPLLVEIKAVGAADQLMGSFADRYARMLIQQQGAVHSLDYQVIARLHQRQAQLPVGLITPFYLTDFTDSVADFYSLQALTVTREQISAAHRQQRPVYLWTVDRPLAMQRLTALGADGLITNHPGQLRRLQGTSTHYYFYQLINWLLSWL